MPLFGAHMSIAGGCHNALTAAKERDFDTVQLFTKNNNQWKAPMMSGKCDNFCDSSHVKFE